MMSYQHETGHFQSSSDELQLFFQRWIPANPKEGHNLVLHHGLGEHSDRYSNVLGMLEGTGITIYAYDVRGHGRSEGKKGLARDVHHLAEDLDTFLDFIEKEYNVNKPLLYGHSMGGAAVLSFVGQKDKRAKVKAVVATGPALGTEKNFYQVVMTLLLACLKKLIPSTTLPSGLDTNNLSRDKNVVAAFKSDPMTHDMIAVSLAFSLLESGRAEIIPKAKEMTLPIFLGHGAKDEITDPKGTQEYYDNCGSTQKTIRIYENCLHEIHNEMPEDKEKVLADLKTFITENM